MNHLTCLIVLGGEHFEDDFCDLVGNVPEDFYLLEEEGDEILLVGFSLCFFAYFGDRHEFFLIAFVHEIGETFLFDKPFGVLVVL